MSGQKAGECGGVKSWAVKRRAGVCVGGEVDECRERCLEQGLWRRAANPHGKASLLRRQT
eukprot:283032-Chlamydomonas_euryale.AAC.2